MLGSLIHEMPLVGGYSGYEPPHGALLRGLIGRLSQPDALQELVDLTHVRWLLLRPADEWGAPALRKAMLAEFRGAPDLGPSWQIDGWFLQRVDLEPGHREWFEALRAPRRADRTLLGASLAPLPDDATGVVRITGDGSRRVRAGAALRVSVEVFNPGSAAWPVLAGGGAQAPGAVHLESTWTALDGAGQERGAVETHALPRDVSAGDRLQSDLWLVAPSRPGPYEVELSLRQTGGRAFERSRDATAHLAVRVEPAVPPG